jgi:hypothetical protein
MLFTRTRLAVTMAMACACFGCKGAGALGGMFRVASAVTVTAVRVAEVVAVAAPSRGPYEGGDVVVVPVAAPVDPPSVSIHRSCVEVPPEPEMPADSFAVRTVVCGHRIMVQDAQTGMWREHR